MPKHTIFNRVIQRDPTPAVHPMWRGIGCIMLVLIPVLSYFISNILIDNRATIPWFAIPQDLIVMSLRDPLLLVRIFYTAVIVLLIFFLVALVTFAVDRIVNPKKKGPFDVD
jgi:hypothetical protein